ncbi:hypothetical protein B5F76_13285 [Desulfovibrio sp. An276]|nr:hypothetical protein B5F76_13285 [Desulfovibrio sp. An276]
MVVWGLRAASVQHKRPPGKRESAVSDARAFLSTAFCSSHGALLAKHLGQNLHARTIFSLFSLATQANVHEAKRHLSMKTKMI